MSTTQLYTAVPGDVITAARWNNEFGNIYDADVFAGSTATGAVTQRSFAAHFADVYHLEDFGVVGNGTDETTALQAAFTFIKANGGTLWDSNGITVKTTGISLTGSAAAWSFRGTRGVTKFVRYDDSGGTMFTSSSSSFPFEMHDFTVDCQHATYPNGNHGFSIADMTGLRLSGIDVVNYKNSAILVFATTPNTFGDCIVTDCSATSVAAVANNGILIAEMPRSGIVRCKAKGATGSPGYGIQLKNNCQYCFITDCYAENCVAGFAFGQDSGISAVKFSSVKGMVSVGCTTGFLAGWANYNSVVDLFVDMSSAGQNALDLNVTCIGNTISATVLNVAALKSAIRMRTASTDNSVFFKFIDNLNSTGKVVTFDSGSERNTVKLERITTPTVSASGPLGLVSNASTTNDNSFEYTPYPTYQTATVASGVVTVTLQSVSSLIVDTEAAAATDDLDTITGVAYEGKVLTLRSSNSGRDTTVKHGTGNILLTGAADFTLSNIADTISVRYNVSSAKWCEIGRGDNA